MNIDDENRTGAKWCRVTGAQGGVGRVGTRTTSKTVKGGQWGRQKKPAEKSGRLRSGPRYMGGNRSSGILLSSFGKAGRTRICGSIRWYHVLSGDPSVNEGRKQCRVQKTHCWDPNHLRLISVLLLVQSSREWIWTMVVPP